jgi:hypothetical protein
MFRRIFQNNFGKSASHFFQIVSGTLFGTEFRTLEIWFLARFFQAFENQEMKLELLGQTDSKLFSSFYFGREYEKKLFPEIVFSAFGSSKLERPLLGSAKAV